MVDVSPLFRQGRIAPVCRIEDHAVTCFKRCGRCGGHLGDRFLDGALFPGTPAALSGQRYCVDGSATVFYPADGSAPVRGEFDPQKPRELPAWAQPPGIKVNG